MGTALSAYSILMRQDLANANRRTDAPPTPTSLRMRIAETRIVQHRVAARLDISDGHLSHLLAGTKPADEALLQRIASAIEAVAADGASPAPV